MGVKLREFTSIEVLEKSLDDAAPMCLISECSPAMLQLFYRIRSNVWPLPGVILSDCAGRMFALHDGVLAVIERPYDIGQMRDALRGGLAYARSKIEYLRQQQAALHAINSLPESHQAVLRELVECRPHKLIAKRLDVSLRTIDARKREIYQHLQVQTLNELITMVFWADGFPSGFEQLALCNSILRSMPSSVNSAVSSSCV